MRSHNSSSRLLDTTEEKMTDETREVRMMSGSHTFGDETVRVRGGKRQARAYWLKRRGEERLAILLRGHRLSRLFPTVARSDRRSFVDMVRCARLPPSKKLIVLLGKRKNLANELEALMKFGTTAKQRMLAPVIERQLLELDDYIQFLTEEVGIH